MCQPGRPVPPRGLPAGVLAWLVRLPQGEVERVLLVLRAAGSIILALVHVLELAVRERPVAGIRAHAEVHVAIGRVRVSADDQRLDVLDYRGNRLGRERLVVGATESQGVSVRAVERGHLGRQLGARSSQGARGVVDLVVDVGDVHHEIHFVALVLEEPLQQAEDHERPRVADVDAAVDGRPARVDPHSTGIAWVQWAQLAAERVVQNDLAHRRATLAISAGGPQTPSPALSDRARPDPPRSQLTRRQRAARRPRARRNDRPPRRSSSRDRHSGSPASGV